MHVQYLYKVIKKVVHKLKEHVERYMYNIFCIGTNDFQNNYQLIQDHELRGLG